MKLITIHQPNYMPWPGFFHKWMLADALIILDTVQYHKNEWQNRNRIKTAQGSQWLTVPVTYRFPQLIKQVEIAPSPWARKQIAAIEQAYSKAEYFDVYWPELKSLLQQSWQSLSALNVAIIVYLGKQLGCNAPLHLASELPISATEPTTRLLELCQYLGGDSYLSGSEGRQYLHKSEFEVAGLGLYFQSVQAPTYKQLHGEFIAYLSLLDLLLNMGQQASIMVRDMGDMQP